MFARNVSIHLKSNMLSEYLFTRRDRSRYCWDSAVGGLDSCVSCSPVGAFCSDTSPRVFFRGALPATRTVGCHYRREECLLRT
jgi:hypothetical protein